MTFKDIIAQIISVIDSIMAVVVAGIVIVFMWRILSAWFIGGGDPKEIERGRQSALVGLFVLIFVFGLWGIVAIVRRTLFSI